MHDQLFSIGFEPTLIKSQSISNRLKYKKQFIFLYLLQQTFKRQLSWIGNLSEQRLQKLPNRPLTVCHTNFLLVRRTLCARARLIDHLTKIELRMNKRRPLCFFVILANEALEHCNFFTYPETYNILEQIKNGNVDILKLNMKKLWNFETTYFIEKINYK